MAGDGKMSADIGKKAGSKPARRGFLLGAGAAAGAAGAAAFTLGKGPQVVATEVAAAATDRFALIIERKLSTGTLRNRDDTAV